MTKNQVHFSPRDAALAQCAVALVCPSVHHKPVLYQNG